MKYRYILAKVIGNVVMNNIYYILHTKSHTLPSIWSFFTCYLCTAFSHAKYKTPSFYSCDDVVGTVTSYGLGSSGIESQRWRVFLHPSRPALGPTQPSVQWVSGLFRGGKAVGTWRWSHTKIKGRVDLYLYFTSGFSWPVLRWTLSYLYIFYILCL